MPGKPLDTQQAHIGILIVADEVGSAQALLLRGAHVALTQGALEAEEEDGRRGIAVHSAEIAKELKEIIEAVCRGQDEGVPSERVLLMSEPVLALVPPTMRRSVLRLCFHASG